VGIVLFDLGNTLETNNSLLPGAKETLTAVRGMIDGNGEAIILGLVADYETAQTPEEIHIFRQEYYGVLEQLGIRSFFEPVEWRVTLSTEVGIRKPDEKIFRTAIDKINPNLHFHEVIFITENEDHVKAVRQLGMLAIHFQRPGETTGEVNRLVDLIPLIERLLEFPPCHKKPSEAIGRFTSQANKSKRDDPGISALTSRVDLNNLNLVISELVDFGTRWSYSPKINEVQEWIHKQFVDMGYEPDVEVNFQEFELPGSGFQRNVLCSKGNSDQGLIMVCGHYDSISENPSVSASGADDNASGLAAILELARLLKEVELKRGVIFAARSLPECRLP